MPLLRVLPASVTHLIDTHGRVHIPSEDRPACVIPRACSAVNIAVDNPDLP